MSDLFIQHCGTYWYADDPMPCPKCGGAGDPLPAVVEVRRVGNMAAVTTREVEVWLALHAAGLTAKTSTVYGPQDGSASICADELARRLRAAGWVVTVRGRGKRRAD